MVLARLRRGASPRRIRQCMDDSPGGAAATQLAALRDRGRRAARCRCCVRNRRIHRDHRRARAQGRPDAFGVSPTIHRACSSDRRRCRCLTGWRTSLRGRAIARGRRAEDRVATDVDYQFGAAFDGAFKGGCTLPAAAWRRQAARGSLHQVSAATADRPGQPRGAFFRRSGRSRRSRPSPPEFLDFGSRP